MTQYQIVDAIQLDADLTSLADAIRAKAGLEETNKLEFPAGMIETIEEMNNESENKLNLLALNQIETITKDDLLGTTLIRPYLFYGTSSFSVVEIPNTVEEIGEYAFKNCSGLQSVDFENEIICTKIGEQAFFGCSKLNNFILPNTIIQIDRDAFNLCESLPGIEIPSGVTSIKSAVFYKCRNLKTITYHNDITDIGAYAFSYCNQLPNPIFPLKVTKINAETYSYCNSFINIVIPKQIKSIEYRAFANCENLTSISFEENSQCLTLEDFAFYRCYSLKSINLPESITNIGGSCFYSTALESLKLPSNLNIIAANLCAYCRSLKNIQIPLKVTRILQGAFQSAALEGVLELPSALQEIGKEAFYDCDRLQAIVINKITPPALTGTGVFGGSNRCKIFVPEESIIDYKTATNWSVYADRIYPITSAMVMYDTSGIDLTSSEGDIIIDLTNNNMNLTAITVDQSYAESLGFGKGVMTNEI